MLSVFLSLGLGLCTAWASTSATAGSASASPLRFVQELTVPPVETATASSVYTGYPASNAFNGNTADGWVTWAASVNNWLEVRYASAFQITGYRVHGPGSGPDGMASWVLKGSSDGTTWATLDTVTGQTWSAGTPRDFQLSSRSASYRWFRFESIQPATSGGNTVVGEVTWADTGPTASPSPTSTASASPSPTATPTASPTPTVTVTATPEPASVVSLSQAQWQPLLWALGLLLLISGATLVSAWGRG